MRFVSEGAGGSRFYAALPAPCLDESVNCRWLRPGPDGAVFLSHAPDALVVLDEEKMIVAECDAVSADASGAVLRLPAFAFDHSARATTRYRCMIVDAYLNQSAIEVHGRLDDFSTASLRVRITQAAAEPLVWFNGDQPVQLRLVASEGLLYSGECVVRRMARFGSETVIVLSPSFDSIRRYRPRKERCIRRPLTPQPLLRFEHPLTGRSVCLQAEDVSCMGVGTEEPYEESTLLAGLILPRIRLEIAGAQVLECRAQVVYRRLVAVREGRNFVRCGIAFLDLAGEYQVRLSALVHQSLDAALRVCSEVDLDGLWHLFFDSGFIYPEKYASLESRKDSLKALYRNLYLHASSVSRHFLVQDHGAVLGHMSMLRCYSSAWLIQHHAALRYGRGNAGVRVLEEMGRFTNDLHLLPSARMSYLICYYRPENRFPSRVFGNVVDFIGDKKGASTDAFSYIKLDALPEPDESAFQLFPASSDDLCALRECYERVSGGLSLDALDIAASGPARDELKIEYSRRGLRLERQLYALRRGGRLLAVIQSSAMDVGLNMSDLTNCIHVFVTDVPALPASTLSAALRPLKTFFIDSDPPVLLFPEAYADLHGIGHEKTYLLWTLATERSDDYFESIRSTFRRDCGDEGA